MAKKGNNPKRGVVDVGDVTDLVVQEQMAPSIVHAKDMADINTMLRVSSELNKGGMFNKTAGSAAAIFTIVLLGDEMNTRYRGENRPFMVEKVNQEYIGNIKHIGA